MARDKQHAGFDKRMPVCVPNASGIVIILILLWKRLG
jgi:hypothetical protein